MAKAHCPSNGLGHVPSDFDAPLRPKEKVFVTSGKDKDKIGDFLGYDNAGRAIVQIRNKRISVPENAVVKADRGSKAEPDEDDVEKSIEVIEVKKDLPNFKLMASGQWPGKQV